MFDLNGKNVLITGSSGGIGRSIARAMHGHGATITLSGTKSEVLETLATELGPRTHVAVSDLISEGAPTKLIETTQAKMGTIDVLVNNAGLTRDSLAIRMKDDDWHILLELNLTVAFKLSRAVIKDMIKKRRGRIINISSVVAITGNPGQANYAAAKAGMVGFTQSIAKEVASRNITVNCVAPGYVETDIVEDLPIDLKQSIMDRVPIGRFGYPEEIAGMVGFLASESASYVTGQAIAVDGGLVIS